MEKTTAPPPTGLASGGPETASASPLREPLSVIFNFPNQITFARLVLSIVFFILLVLDNHGYFGAHGDFVDSRRQLWLNGSIAVFVLAAVTDIFDGYLARKWNMISSFGRMADPIVDKVFICGSFVLLVKTCDLVHPWIPVIILTREFLVAGLRSFLESHGVPFGAGFGGKLKMVFQSLTIPFALLYSANFPVSAVLKWTVISLLSATILLTITSSLEYVIRAYSLLVKERER
ncbi:MAG: CDP-diacylglycerol--glycerol-3-phosphate 3-phosphatidyltransferase [Planctomycetes bacterium]|nr:CDP-diacylglycerol--glycerol-3-phosphate 3-phosphatidyltransferase [Planctomycetota bacterium]